MPDSQAVEVSDQAVAEDAVADPDEPDLGVRLQDGGRNGHDVTMSLEIEEAGDRCEGDLVIGQPQLAANLFAGTTGVQEGVGVHAAVDGEELLALSNPRRERLLGHGVANGNDCVTAPCGPAFQEDVKAVPEPAFKCTKRHAVNGMHDDRHFLVPGGRAAQDSRLRAVRMHDLGLEPSKSRAVFDTP